MKTTAWVLVALALVAICVADAEQSPVQEHSKAAAGVAMP